MTHRFAPKTPKNLWIDNILVGVEPLSDPIREFSKYARGGLSPYYNNFIDYVGVSLYDNADFEDFIKKYARKFDFYKITIEKLQELHVLLDSFYDQCFDLYDFEVIRRTEWDVMMPVAKECIRLLEQEKKKGDMVLSDEDM